MNDYTILENLFKDEQDEIHIDLFKESNVIKINNNNGDNNNFDNGISFFLFKGLPLYITKSLFKYRNI